jgi:hypothetical protein
MAHKPKPGVPESVDVLKDLLIVQLGLAGVPQQKIRSIVGCDIGRVNRIVRHLRTKAPRKGET